MIKVTYKEQFSYDDPKHIEFNSYEDFGRWYIRRFEDIKIENIRMEKLL